MGNYKTLIIINFILLGIFVLISFITIIFIIIYYYKLEDLKKEEESCTIINMNIFQKILS